MHSASRSKQKKRRQIEKIKKSLGVKKCRTRKQYSVQQLKNVLYYKLQTLKPDFMEISLKKSIQHNF